MDGDRDQTHNLAHAEETSGEGDLTQMDSSFSSLVFKGPVSQAIVAAKVSMKILFVYIGGSVEDCDRLEQSTWRDSEVVKLLSEQCVVLHLVQGSADALHFSAIYPYESVPAMSAVGYNGMLLWHHEGYISAQDLIGSVEKARADLHSQEVTAANIIATAIAASRREPTSNIPPVNEPSPLHESITGRVDTSSLGEIPLSQSPRSCTVRESSLGTEETQQTVVAARLDGQEDMASGNAMHVAVTPNRSSTNLSECGSIPNTIQSSSSLVETPESLLFTDTINVPTCEIVEPENSADTSAFSLGESEGETLVDDCKLYGEQKRNIASSDLGSPTTEIVPEIETSDHGSNPVFDDQSSVKPVVRDLSSIHLQIRLLNGASLQAKFAATDTLRRVKDYISKNRTDGNRAFSLAIPYPRKVFSEEDMEKVLLELNLGTRAAIILVPDRSAGYPSDWHSSSNSNSMGGPSSPQHDEAGPGFLARILSYLNPFSYFGGSSANQESTSRDSVWQYGPNPSLQNALKDDGQSNMYTSKSNISGKGQKLGGSSNVERKGWGSNIHTLKHDEDEAFRDRNAFWNGNSTQFGGDDSKRD
uniref:UBX domain-containing protein n=1 Tax=Araucaria cunninghamii TaxID=56994 RepID=A0A0D6QTM1_ARACU